MTKDILAFFGLVFLTLLIVVGVAWMGSFYDQIGVISLPEGLLETPASLFRSEVGITALPGVSAPQWSNPLDQLPTATLEPPPTLVPPPATPLPPTAPPPLAPQVYRAEVVMRLKRFAAALERWLAANQQLAGDAALLDDPAWQQEVHSTLAEVSASALEMAGVGPAPGEYEGIDAWLDRAAYEAAELQRNYAAGLDAHARGGSGADEFRAAGENFTRIKEYLTLAVNEMLAQGWSME